MNTNIFPEGPLLALITFRLLDWITDYTRSTPLKFQLHYLSVPLDLVVSYVIVQCVAVECAYFHWIVL